MKLVSYSVLAMLLAGPGCKDSKPSAREKAAAEAPSETSMAKTAKDAEEAKTKLETAVRELDELNAKVTAALTALTDAKTDADRAATKAQLWQLQKDQTDLKQRVDTARRAAEAVQRPTDVKLSKECVDNPLAKGCS